MQNDKTSISRNNISEWTLWTKFWMYSETNKFGNINWSNRCLYTENFKSFFVQNQCYQCKILCIGPVSAPKVFNEIVLVAAAFMSAFMRTRNIRLIVVYLIGSKPMQKNFDSISRDLLESSGFVIYVHVWLSNSRKLLKKNNKNVCT